MRIIVAAAGLAFVAAAQAQPLALFTFDDGTATDLSGSGHHGTLVGTPLFVSGGVDGGAVQFNGTNALRLSVDINPTSQPKITVGGWVYSSLINPTRHFISHDNTGYDRDLCIDTRGGGTGWSAFKGNGVLGYIPAITTGWQFVAAVYDDTAGTVMLYVDGQVRTTTGRPGAGNTYLYVGRSTCCDNGLAGLVDGVFILPEALTKERLDEIRAGGIRRAPTCPLFLRQPQPYQACARDTVSLTVDPAGSGTLWAVWQRETAPGSNVFLAVADGPTGTGSVVSGTFTANLQIQNVGMADVGRYRCVLNNSCGSVPSNSAEVSVCSANFNCDGVVDFFDYLDFTAALAAAQPEADFNRDGVIDFFDYLDFVEALSGGC